MSGPGRHFLVRADEIHMGNMSELAPIKLINLGYYECVAESAAPVHRTLARRTTAGDVHTVHVQAMTHRVPLQDPLPRGNPRAYKRVIACPIPFPQRI